MYGALHRVTRVAPLGRAASLSSTRRFDPESPIRWLVRALLGDTGLCGSERGELSDVGPTASNGESGTAGCLLASASRAEARCCAEVPFSHQILRKPSLVAWFHRASRGCEFRAAASPTAPRARVEDGRGAPPCDRAARAATACQGPTEGCDLPRLRPPLLRSGAQGRLVRVPPFDESREWPVSGPLPDGLERTTPVRPRPDGAPAGDRSPQVLRRLGTRLEPLELQAGLRLLLEPFVANCATRRRARVSFLVLFC